MRRVRTAAGVSRYDKPIGTPISRVKIGRGENIVPRISADRRASKAKLTGRVQAILTGTAPRKDLEYASPRRRAQALAETGTVRLPVRDAVRAQREQSKIGSVVRRRTEKAVNPFTGQTVAVRGGAQPRAVSRASVVRKVRAATSYTGRRRA